MLASRSNHTTTATSPRNPSDSVRPLTGFNLDHLITVRGTADEARQPNTIFYVKVTKPWLLHPVTIVGPFFPVSTLLPQIRYTLQTEDMILGTNFKAFQKILLKAHPLISISELRAPLSNGQTMKLQIKIEQNDSIATLVHRLAPGQPKPIYTVWILAPLDFNLHRPPRNGLEAIPVVEADIRSTFTTIKAANLESRASLYACVAENQRQYQCTWRVR
ncbi:hypothetical protein EJ04DRAFT_525224 [Polyplosphaeria fusca]|uniref:Uncharacterized protein n=1 Tax=Polyplosphaeria fusca TaxID=682080 RepID=A0A9P4V0Y7_9PLEO|nr:hypothetical protein EJ04DRAFT_525224 [Polyplosphaeria fusca]